MDEKYQNIRIGTINLDHKTSSTKIIMDAVMKLYQKITNKQLLIRRINISANNVVDEKTDMENTLYEQIDLFTNYHEKIKKQQDEHIEKKLQKTIINIKKEIW